MSREDTIIKAVESNFALEGMNFSSREKKTMRDCLSGRTTFDSAVEKVIARYKRI
ncbi:antitoxin VbhA family protein [Candidatus Saccharibacteria bacterium]|nr:antitoxin VbhA family protein [Candidatus Saccharibacteria bacterium]